MSRKIARLFIHVFLRLVSRIEVIGVENVPRSGAYIIASNHLGRLDVPLIYHLLDRPDVIMLVAEKYRKSAFIRWFVKQLDGIWVDRFNADFGAMRAALSRLRKGHVLALAPEGTRSPTEALIQARPGTSYLAAKAGVPIIPVAVSGTEDAHVLACFRRLRRPLITIRAGKSFNLPPLPRQERESVLQQYTDEIMCRIAALLPPQYRGVYADHPRLKELLASM